MGCARRVPGDPESDHATLRCVSSGPAGDQQAELPTQRTAKWLALLTLVPFLGVVLFGVAAALGLRAFAHNNSLDCGYGAAASCSHYSYVPAIVLGVVAIVVLMGGGALASYYAMRNVGLPLVAALRQRRAGR